MNSYSFIVAEKLNWVMKFRVSPYVSIKTFQKEKRNKGEVFLTLVKTIQC